MQKLSGVSSVSCDESPVLDGDSCDFKVEKNFDGNGNKEKKTSQKISTGNGFASLEGHVSSRRYFSSLAAPNNTC